MVAKVTRVGIAPRYSDIVVHDGVAYFSGYIPEKTLGQSVSDQTKDVLDQIEESLVQIGSDKSKLLQATIWLADIGTFDEMNAVWDAWVLPGQTPARACVQSRLADPRIAIEICVKAAVR